MSMSSIRDYKIGMTVYGKITGIKPYGAFVSFEDGVSGLIHISELSYGFVRDVNHYVKLGDYVMTKVIDIDAENRQLRLSYKALGQNTRRYTKRVRFLGMPANERGFSSLSEALPKWIGERKL